MIDRTMSRRLGSLGCTSVMGGGGHWWRGAAGGAESLADIHERFEWAAWDIADALGLVGHARRRAADWMLGTASVKTRAGYMSMDVLGPNGERVRTPNEAREMVTK